MKEWYKVGRGGATAIDGVIGLGEKAVENPERIPGALGALGRSAYEDPIGTGKSLVGYDELAAGRYSDWLGQFGIGALAGGAGTVPARASRMNRVVGSPRVQPLGRKPMPNNAGKFARRRFDFGRDGFGARPAASAPALSPPSARTSPSATRAACASPVPATRCSRRTPPSAWSSLTSTAPPTTSSGRTRPPVCRPSRRATRGTTSRTGGRWSSSRRACTGRCATPVAPRACPTRGTIAPGGAFTPFERGAAQGGGAAGFLAAPIGAEASAP